MTRRLEIAGGGTRDRWDELYRWAVMSFRSTVELEVGGVMRSEAARWRGLLRFSSASS